MMSIRILSCMAVLSLVHALGYAQSVPSASLREPLNQVMVLSDSGIVADRGITLYVAVEPLHWIAIEMPEGERIVGLAGGTASRPLVLMQKDEEVGKGLERYELKAVLLKGELLVVASDIPKPCVFLNDEIGAYADGGNIAITRDGARTWKSSPISLAKKELTPRQRVLWTIEEFKKVAK